MMTAEAGVPLRHADQGRNIAMHRTGRDCRPAGRIKGSMVVSMRQVPVGLVDSATRAGALMPAAHGSPLHVGDPAALGIKDLARPDFGDPVEAEPGDAPVFWACGVTPQTAPMVLQPSSRSRTRLSTC
ncbi:D-glutamate cyclase family protein [Streptomyces sp. NPDC054802]